MPDKPRVIPTREEMVDMLWTTALEGETRPNEKAQLCRTIASLMGYNRGDDYSDIKEQLNRLEAEPIAEPELPYWEQPGYEPH